MKKKSVLLLLSTLLVAISPNKLEILKSIEKKHILKKFTNNEENLSQQKSPTLEVKSLVNMTLGDVKKGEKIFIKNLQGICKLSSISFAGMHSQDEWEAIVQAGEFESEIFTICPKVKKSYQKAWSPNLYQFVYEYANDTGNVPSS